MHNLNVERDEFEYSMKNIPVPADKEYIKRFIEKSEEFKKSICNIIEMHTSKTCSRLCIAPMQ